MPDVESPLPLIPDDGKRLLSISTKNDDMEVELSFPEKIEKEKLLDKNNKKCFYPFNDKIRYLILLLTILCLTLTRSNEISFNFNVICMTMNSSSIFKDDPVEMTTDEISTIMSSGGSGALLFVFPMIYLLHHFGCRLIFGILLFCSGISTILMGPMAKISPLWMIPGRYIQGFALSTVMPIIGAVSAEWAPLTEIGKFVTMLSAAGQLSQILTMPLSAYLCINNGWSSVYTVHGLLACIAAIVFVGFYRNNTKKHPFITEKELKIISHGAKQRSNRSGPSPYLKIIKSAPVWAVWIAFLGNAIGYQLIIQFMPTFLNKVLKISIHRIGLFTIIPPITQLIIKIISGYISDKLKLSEKFKLQLFNSIAQIGCALFLLPLGFIKLGNEIFAIICFSSSISCLGLVTCGSMKSATLIARSFTHFVMAVVQAIVSISMLFVPYMVGAIAPDNTVEQWKWVFFTVFFILIFTNSIFCIFCSAEPQPWAIVQKEQVLQS